MPFREARVIAVVAAASVLAFGLVVLVSLAVERASPERRDAGGRAAWGSLPGGDDTN